MKSRFVKEALTDRQDDDGAVTAQVSGVADCIPFTYGGIFNLRDNGRADR